MNLDSDNDIFGLVQDCGISSALAMNNMMNRVAKPAHMGELFGL